MLRFREMFEKPLEDMHLFGLNQHFLLRITKNIDREKSREHFLIEIKFSISGVKYCHLRE